MSAAIGLWPPSSSTKRPAEVPDNTGGRDPVRPSRGLSSREREPSSDPLDRPTAHAHDLGHPVDPEPVGEVLPDLSFQGGFDAWPSPDRRHPTCGRNAPERQPALLRVLLPGGVRRGLPPQKKRTDPGPRRLGPSSEWNSDVVVFSRPMPKAASLRNLRPWSPGQSGNRKGRPRTARLDLEMVVGHVLLYLVAAGPPSSARLPILDFGL